MNLPKLYQCADDVCAVLDHYAGDDSQEAQDTIEAVQGVCELTGYGTEESANWMKKHWNED